MDKVSECLDSLVLEMQESKEYQNYLWMEQELKIKIDDYRIRNYRLQQAEDVDLFDAVDSLEHDFYDLRKNQKANAYLEAELAVCKMIQKVQQRITDEIHVFVPEY